MKPFPSRFLLLPAALLLYCTNLSHGAEPAVLSDSLSKQTILFAHRDTCDLRMDIYRTETAQTEQTAQPVMLFVFGGAFMKGDRDKPYYIPYFRELAAQGITAVSIDYRLGLKDRKISVFKTKPADTAIRMAVEDLFSATDYLIRHAAALNIDTSCIMLSGSSAGAVTVLHADYTLCNRLPLSEMLPQDFRYKGVLSFAGAIFSHEGRPRYRATPAPTLFMHGDKDKVVPYNKIQLFSKGLFGSKSLARRFRKAGYPYAFFTMQGQTHDVALTGMYHPDEITWFVRRYVFEHHRWQMNAELDELDRLPREAYTKPYATDANK